MRKSLFASLIAGMLCASAVFAEKGGGYLGIDIGHGNAKFDQNIDAIMTVPVDADTQRIPLNGNIYASNSMANITIKGGYKTFFGESRRFGVRGYVYFGYGYSSMQNINYDFSGSGAIDYGSGFTIPVGQIIEQLGEMNGGSIFTGTGKTYYNHVFDYGVGGDLLFNFIDATEHSFGIYGGVALGAETWVANGKEYKPSEGSESYFGFQTTINAGIRGVFNEHHGIEFGVKFPLLDTQIFKGSGYSSLMNNDILVNMGGSVSLNNTTTTMKRPYIIHASYVYNF
ncbi:hypothetical protein CQA49_04210 [Helicobacter sp. MIT 00-7814]|uniref:outer membrane beta-barrel protein n=1 Tax=unclassified Helicobacter TaxID=2593540 RepID=UPI000E1E5D2D|nr:MULTISPECIES: outer membrane beta-barrel protein [unclassified Helicobacter]RDU51938.1 hypothetical protein CQA37_09125 [Helicobacter sp. MIT 99-10781]RDU55039.1 hypothetical protein CQA49_04210 [Helicobacter sp. MIT 00-7814]